MAKVSLAQEQRLIPDCRISLDGNKLALDDDASLTRLKVDLDVDLFGECSLLFNDPRLRLINGTSFAAGAAVKVELGFGAQQKKVFEGEVVALEPLFYRDQPVSLRVVCQESLHRLALSQMTRAFNEVDDKEVAAKIAQEHGLSAEAPAGTKQHLLQGNVTDATFLRRLAQKHGNHLRIEGKKLIIGPPPAGRGVAIGPADGLKRMKVRIAASQQVGQVTVHGWDPKSRQEIVGKASPAGEIGAGGRKHGGGASLAFAGHEHAPADVASAEAMAKGRLRKISEGFVVAQGEIIGKPEIVPGEVLDVHDLGALIDGKYRVDHATHEFSKHGYLVRFKAVRIGKKPAPKPAPKVSSRSAAQARSDAEDRAARVARQRANQPAPVLSEPRWSDAKYQHGDVADMQVRVKNGAGKRVKFTVERHLGKGGWEQVAETVVPVQGGLVKASVPIEKPVHLSAPRWEKRTHRHGELAAISVDAGGLPDGRTVRFVVERAASGGKWVKIAETTGEVRAGKASAIVQPQHGEPDRRGATAQSVRFRAEVVHERTHGQLRFRAEIEGD